MHCNLILKFLQEDFNNGTTTTLREYKNTENNNG